MEPSQSQPAQPTESPQPTQPPSAAPQVVTPEVPATWPGAWGLYKYSKTTVKFNLETILVLCILNLVVGGVFYALLGNAGRLGGNLVGAFLNMALTFAYLASVRGQKISLGQAFGKCDPMLYLKFLANTILVGIGLAISLLLLVVPFFFVLPRVLLAPFFLLDKDMGPYAAITASWDATKGHTGMIWGVIGATLAMALLMVTIIGIPFSLYFLFMYGASSVLVYEYITHLALQATTAPAPQTPSQPTV